MLARGDLPFKIRTATDASINNSLKRNLQLNRVTSLLVPPPPPSLQRQQQQHATNMILKISHKAITKFAAVGNSNNAAGASAILKLFQIRPGLLGKRRIKKKRPPVVASCTLSRRQLLPRFLDDNKILRCRKRTRG
jgi:hypothetical protein